MCMIQTWRGGEPTEDAFHEGALPKGHGMHLAEVLDRVRARLISPGEENEIDLALRLGSKVIVMINGPRYMGSFLVRYPDQRSPHGDLCEPGDWGQPFHYVLLIERVEEGYSYFDPWYPGEAQPFYISEDSFQWCFAGWIAVAKP